MAMTPVSEVEKIKADPSRLRKTSWREYAVRFAFGGLITALAGLLGQSFGAAIGGLFLGFPAILPASLTLVKKHEGEEAAGEDARGAESGSIGLIVFGALIWGLAAHLAAWLLLILAMIAWLAVSIVAWLVSQRVSPWGRREEEGNSGS